MVNKSLYAALVDHCTSESNSFFIAAMIEPLLGKCCLCSPSFIGPIKLSEALFSEKIESFVKQFVTHIAVPTAKMHYPPPLLESKV